jgi:hypothetical protein
MATDVNRYRMRGTAMAIMSAWMLHTETFGGDHHWLVLNTGAALFALQAWSDFRLGAQLRRDEQARK